MIDRAKQLSEKDDYYFTDQLNNSDIIKGFEKMRDEIQNQLEKPIHGFCSSIGTAGALMGVSNVLLRSKRKPKIVALEPESAAFYS